MADWRVSLSNFLGGRNDRMATELLSDNEAQTASDVDLGNGHLAGMNDTASSATATAGSASVNSIWYAAGSAWIDPTKDKMGTTQSAGEAGEAVEKRWFCNDGYKTYFTRVGKQPHVALPMYQHPLGLVPITGFAWSISAGQLTGTFQYAITFATDTGIESNPMGFEWIRNLSSNQVAFSSIPTSPDPRVIRRRIWRTQANGSTLYLRAVIDDNTTTSYTDGGTAGDSNDAVLDLSQPLSWRVGGWSGSGSDYTADHSAPPPLTVLSNTLHSVNDAAGISGSGMLFGGLGAVAYWTLLGYPDYWPIVNTFTLPENIEAIVSHAGTTFYFLASGIYQVSGSSDETLSWSRTNARYGVMPGEGRTVKQMSSGGIIFKSREGIALFDGSTARLVGTQKISASALRALTINDAAFYDNKYHLFHSTGTLTLDFTDSLDDPRVTTSSLIVRCAAVASTTDPVTATMGHPGLGLIQEIVVTDSGSGYTSAPAVTVGAPTSGTTATGTTYVNVDRVVITDEGGTGYTAAPDVVFSAPAAGGRPARGTATISGGAVASIEVTDAGAGYTGVPTITLTGGGGSGATTSVLVKVEKVAMTNGGSGYSSTKSPSLSFAAAPTGERTAQGMAVVTPQGMRWAGLIASQSNANLSRIGGLYIDVLIGGAGDTDDNTTDLYNGVSWSRQQNLNTARFNITPVLIGSTIYVYGGTTTPATPRTGDVNTMETGTGTSAWAVTGAQTPGSLCGYGAATDGTDLYLYGGYDSSGNPTAKLWKYTVATTTWSDLTVATPAPASSERGDCALAYANGSLYVVGGQQTTTTTDNLQAAKILIYNIATPAWTTDTNGPSVGYAARVSCAVGVSSNKLYIYGGRTQNANTGTPMSDLWEYDPAQSGTAKWHGVGSVVGVPPLARMAYGISGTKLYLMGGNTPYTLVSADLYVIDVQQIADWNLTTGLYTVEDSDAGAIRRWDGGSALTWTWRSKDFTAPKMGPYLNWTRMRVEASGTVAVKISKNGGAVNTVKTLSSVSRATPQTFRLTAGGNARGQRLALELVGTTSATVHRVDIEGYYDGEAPGP